MKIDLKLLKTKSKLTTVTLKFGSRTVKALAGRKVTTTITLRNLPKGRFTATITVAGTKGFRYRESRNYGTCAKH